MDWSLLAAGAGLVLLENIFAVFFQNVAVFVFIYFYFLLLLSTNVVLELRGLSAGAVLV